jgi:uncharacterized protein (UPF0332 family)
MVTVAVCRAAFNGNFGLPDMNFDWSGYLDLAKELNDNSIANREAKQRSAVSRAYYAVFNLAKNYLEQVEGHSIPKTADAHRYVGDQFRMSTNPNGKTIARDLVRLRRFRNQADYAAGFPALSSIVTGAIVTAESIATTLKSFRG